MEKSFSTLQNENVSMQKSFSCLKKKNVCIEKSFPCSGKSFSTLRKENTAVQKSFSCLKKKNVCIEKSFPCLEKSFSTLRKENVSIQKLKARQHYSGNALNRSPPGRLCLRAYSTKPRGLRPPAFSLILSRYVLTVSAPMFMRSAVSGTEKPRNQ